MIQIRHILCPVDFSDYSRAGLDHAVAVARWYESNVTALYVHPLMQWVDARSHRVRSARARIGHGKGATQGRMPDLDRAATSSGRRTGGPRALQADSLPDRFFRLLDAGAGLRHVDRAGGRRTADRRGGDDI
jgi:hypothetical protein